MVLLALGIVKSPSSHRTSHDVRRAAIPLGHLAMITNRLRVMTLDSIGDVVSLVAHGYWFKAFDYHAERQYFKFLSVFERIKQHCDS